MSSGRGVVRAGVLVVNEWPALLFPLALAR